MTVSNAFLTVCNLSINAGYLVLTLLALRLVFRRLPKWVSCLMWGVVGLRLMLPVTPESVLSLLPSKGVLPPDMALSPLPQIDSGIGAVDGAVNPWLGQALAPAPGDSANPLQVLLPAAAWLWLAGIGAMLLYGLISYDRVRRRVAASIRQEETIYVCDGIDTPFILGVFRPRIYLPSGMDPQTVEYVLRHERAHLSRRDHLWKPLGFLLLAVYWFQPLCWIAYICLCRDMEGACDARVIASMDAAEKKRYAQALVDAGSRRRLLLVCPLAFGEVGVKERIKAILNYKKPTLWVLIGAGVLAAVLVVGFLTVPADPAASTPVPPEETAPTVPDKTAPTTPDETAVLPTDGWAVEKIVNRAQTENIPIDTAEETFWEDNRYTYTFPGQLSQYVTVYFQNGQTMPVKEVLRAGHIQPVDLRRWGILYYTKEKTGGDYVPVRPDETTGPIVPGPTVTVLPSGKPDSVKVNYAHVVKVADGMVVVECQGDDYIHRDDPRYAGEKQLAFPTRQAASFRPGDRVKIVHNGTFTPGQPPVAVTVHLLEKIG